MRCTFPYFFAVPFVYWLSSVGTLASACLLAVILFANIWLFADATEFELGLLLIIAVAVLAAPEAKSRVADGSLLGGILVGLFGGIGGGIPRPAIGWFVVDPYVLLILLATTATLVRDVLPITADDDEITAACCCWPPNGDARVELESTDGFDSFRGVTYCCYVYSNCAF